VEVALDFGDGQMALMSKPQPLVRHRSFIFTARSIRNALQRDRVLLAAKRHDFTLFCGVRQLARIERWLDGAVEDGPSEVEFPSGPTAEEIGFHPATARWFDRLIRERRYCQARCSKWPRIPKVSNDKPHAEVAGDSSSRAWSDRRWLGKVAMLSTRT
jgi:hypothetical protein